MINVAPLVLLASLGCRSEDDTGPVDTDTVDTVDTVDTGDLDTGQPIPENVYTVDEDVYWDEDITLGTVWFIAEGVTLTIAEGVTVSFLPSAGIMVDGTLISEGSAENAVHFVIANTLSTGNYGVSLGGSGDASNLDYTTFDGVNLRVEGGGTAGLSGTAFTDSTLGIYSRDDAFTVTDCSFSENRRDNQTAMVARHVAQLSVTGSSFTGVANGIIYDGTATSATIGIASSTFTETTRAAFVGYLGEYPTTFTVDTVTVETTSAQAFAFYGTDATFTDVTISDSRSYGLYGDGESTLTWSGGSVEDTLSTGVYVAGSMDLTDITVTNSDSHGIYAGEEGSSLTRVTVSDTEGHGVYGNGPLTVTDSGFSQVRNSGIYTAYGDLVVLSTTVSNTLGTAIYAVHGDLTAENVTVSDVEGTGIYANNGDLTIRNSAVTGARSYGLYSYRGDLFATDVTVSAVESHAVFANDGSITAENVTVDGARGYGIYATYGDVTLTDVIVSDTISSAVYANRGNILVNTGTTGLLIEDSDGIGLYANTGNISADSVTINRVRSHGIYAAYGSVSVSNADLNEIGGSGVYATYGDVTLTDATITDYINSGVYVYQANATVSNVTMDEVGERGVYINRGSLDVSDTTINAPVYRALYVNKGDLIATDVSISDSGSGGLYVSDGDAVLERVRVVDLDADGSSAKTTAFDVRGHLQATDVLVDQGDTYGIYAQSGDISYATLTNNGGRAVYLYGAELASTISYSELSGNVIYGAQGPSSGENLLAISYSNIRDNDSYGVAYASSLDNSYVADNYGAEGVDTTEDPDLDDALTSSTQLYRIDLITNVQSAEVVGVGSTLSVN